MSMRRILRSLLGTPLKWLNIESDQRMSDTLQLVANLRRYSTQSEKSQYHLAVAGGCEAFLCVTSVDLCGSVVLMIPNCSTTETRRTLRMHREKLRTHPLPRGGTDCSPLS